MKIDRVLFRRYCRLHSVGLYRRGYWAYTPQYDIIFIRCSFILRVVPALLKTTVVTSRACQWPFVCLAQSAAIRFRGSFARDHPVFHPFALVSLL